MKWLLRLVVIIGSLAAGLLPLLTRPAASRVSSEFEDKRNPKRAGVKRWLLRFAGFLVLLAIAGFLVSASGIISIKASAGHWAITRWFLEFSKSRSVATHTIGKKAPQELR